VLVNLLDNGPMPLALLAEDLLSLLANEKGPNAPLSDKMEVRKQCHAAWQDWLSKNQDKIELAKIDVDSPFGSITLRATRGADQFIKALLKFDAVLIAKVTDVPFTLGGMLTFNTREEFDNFVNMIKGQPMPKEITFVPRKVIPASEYMKTAVDFERNFLEASRPAQVHIVYMDIVEGGNREQGIPFFIRISGGRAKCIGFGNPRGM